MPSVHNYTQAYIASTRQRFDDQLHSYVQLVDGSSAPNVSVFEQKFCQAMLLALDNSFAQRSMPSDYSSTDVSSVVRKLSTDILLKRESKVTLTTGKLARLSRAFFDAMEQTSSAAAA
jgi:hypothetical protein